MDRLLIVEDSPSLGALLKKRIESQLGLSVVWTRSLAETRTVIEREGEKFLLGILDLFLPDAREEEVVLAVLSHSIPAVVLTGEINPELRTRLLSKGVLDYFIKDHISVVDSVIHYIDRIRRNRSLRALVVEDSRSFRQMACTLLTNLGFEVLEAGDGQEAWEILTTRDPHLVLTDFAMPRVDGFQLTRNIRARYSREQMAVIGLSSNHDPELATRFIKAGANDFLVKPFRIEELFCRVSQSVEIIEKHRYLESQVRERTQRLEEAHHELKSRENHLQSILETALDAIVSMDLEGRVIDLNPAAVELFGYPRAELMGRRVAETILPPSLSTHHAEAVQDWLRQGGERPNLRRRIEMPARRADGRVIDVEMALTSTTSRVGVTLTGFIHDITERRQVKSLEETLTAAESANRAKSEFLANMSHEIRTPMNAIIGMTDLVLGTTLGDDQRESLEIVQNSAQALLELINSILDLSKIQAGRMILEQIAFDLLGRVEKVVETLSVRAHKKELELFCRVAPGVPETLVGDPLRLNQILLNLVSNAVKFTVLGEVFVNVEAVGPPPGAPGTGRGEGVNPEVVWLEFSVSDTGIGIPSDRLGAIFEQFTQVDGSTTRQYGGTGLGLTISKHLVELMGGGITVESVEGKGSRFSFTVPFLVGERGGKQPGRVMEERQGVEPRSALAGLRILVAYEAERGRTILGELLEGFGAEVASVGDGAGFLALLAIQGEAGLPFDVLLMDHHFLVRFPVFQTSLADAGWRGRMIVLLASNQRLQEKDALVSGREVVSLRKPVGRFRLLNAVNKLTGRETGGGRTDGRQASLPFAAARATVPLRILLAEDLVNNQKLAVSVLEQAGHVVTVAESGLEALEQLGHTTFDLVLMDLQMPGMGGYEASLRIREGKGFPEGVREIPIIAVTAHALESERKSCLEAGMNGFLRKPYRPWELLEVISPFARRGPPVRRGVRKRMGQETLIPVEAADLAAFGVNRTLFVTEGEGRLEALRRALTERDGDRTLREVDWFKRSAARVGAARVKGRALRLGGKVELKHWEESEKLLGELAAEFAKARESLATSSGAVAAPSRISETGIP
ncbi:MAG: response regulator [Magnetococcales bacterium]|nr:response regulator [Magnetococcales bacterium]